MAAKWCRPASIPVPTVWRECKGLKPLEDGRVPRFVIQDVPEDRHEDFVEFMAEHFFRDEVTCECLHLQQDLHSVEELKQVYREVLKENVALVAFIKGEDGQNKQKIAGLNLLAVAHRSEKLKADMFTGRVVRTLMRDLYENISNEVNVYDIFGVDEYLTALGLCVDPKYRGQGLGLELLRTRVDLGRAVGLKVTSTVFTAVPSQILAERAGFRTLKEIRYEDLREEDGSPAYPNIKNDSLKVMAMRLD